MAFTFDLLAVASINARTPRWRKTAVHLPVEQDSVTSVYIYVRFSRREALKISIYSLHAVYYSYRRVNWLFFWEKGEGMRIARMDECPRTDDRGKNGKKDEMLERFEA